MATTVVKQTMARLRGVGAGPAGVAGRCLALLRSSSVLAAVAVTAAGLTFATSAVAASTQTGTTPTSSTGTATAPTTTTGATPSSNFIVNESAVNAALAAAANRAHSNIADFGSPVPGAPPALGSSTAATPDVTNGDPYLIYGNDSIHVQNAKACANSTTLIMWTVVNNCTQGSNEIWQPAVLSNGYDIIRADFSGYLECMWQNGSDQAPVYVYECPTANFDTGYQFREPARTPAPCASGWYYIVPRITTSYSLNAQGGPQSGHAVIDYPQSGCPINDLWYFSPFS